MYMRDVSASVNNENQEIVSYMGKVQNKKHKIINPISHLLLPLVTIDNLFLVLHE